MPEQSTTTDAPPVIGAVGAGGLHVMSYNMRFPTPDPQHLWEDRRGPMIDLIRRESPCVLSTQEGFYGPLEELRAGLDGYEWIGLGRAGGSRDEHVAVFVNTARIDVLEFDHLWLSDTPRLIGSTSWGNEITRMLTWIRMRTPIGEVVLINTHLDHVSETARLRGAELIAELAAGFAPTPVILTGDFNADAGSAPYRALTGPVEDTAPGPCTEYLHDTWTGATSQVTPSFGTFPNYGSPETGRDRIDWILASASLRAERAAINPCAGLSRMPSDHLPVHAVLRASE